MTYRNDVDALAARHATLAAEVNDKTRELAAAAQLLDEARTRAKVPVLDNIRVATPCSVEWAQMTGDDRVRACGSCNKNVYNLAQLTRDEAEALIAEREGNLCVRYFQRKDGTILLADCVIGKKHKRNRRVLAVSAAAALSGISLGATLANHRTKCAPPVHDISERGEFVTGQMAIHDPPPPPIDSEKLTEVRGRMSLDGGAVDASHDVRDYQSHGRLKNKVSKIHKETP